MKIIIISADVRRLDSADSREDSVRWKMMQDGERLIAFFPKAGRRNSGFGTEIQTCQSAVKRLLFTQSVLYVDVTSQLKLIRSSVGD